MAVVSSDLQRRRHEEAALLPSDPREIHLDADLEQQQHHADVGQQLDLLAVRDVARRERRHGHAQREVADDGGQADTPGDPAERRGRKQDEAELEDRTGGEIHARQDTGSPPGRRPPTTIRRVPVTTSHSGVPAERDLLWRSPDPKPAYDVVIVGAGGHGLATAYYLAKNHGITDVAVLERGHLGLGNMGRNTTVIRSNYLWDASAGIYEFSLKLWETLEDDLDFDVLLSQRGVVNLAHSLHDVREGPAAGRWPTT